jgi:hypothetical protein
MPGSLTKKPGHPGSGDITEPERRSADYLDERRAVRDREAALRAPVLRAVVFRFAGDRFAVVLRAVVLRAVDRFAVDFRFAAVFRFAVDRFAVERLAVVLRAAVFFAAAFLFVPAFLAVDFLAVDFFRAELRLELFAELRPDDRVPERDEERVVAGTARATSATSSVSPIADSPHASSATGSAAAVGSLHEPVGVSDASPVPLQSSSVM